jgi:hypothetical protein
LFFPSLKYEWKKKEQFSVVLEKDLLIEVGIVRDAEFKPYWVDSQEWYILRKRVS